MSIPRSHSASVSSVNSWSGADDAGLDHARVVDEHVDRARLGHDALRVLPDREVRDHAARADLRRPLVNALRRGA